MGCAHQCPRSDGSEHRSDNRAPTPDCSLPYKQSPAQAGRPGTRTRRLVIRGRAAGAPVVGYQTAGGVSWQDLGVRRSGIGLDRLSILLTSMVLLAALAGCTTHSMESATHFCGTTFFNFQPQRLPASKAVSSAPPTSSELPPLSQGSKAYRLVLLLGDCNHGSLVSASPITGVVVNRMVLAHDGTIAALALTPVQDTVIKAWRGGRLVGAATLTTSGSLLPVG